MSGNRGDCEGDCIIVAIRVCISGGTDTAVGIIGQLVSRTYHLEGDIRGDNLIIRKLGDTGNFDPYFIPIHEFDGFGKVIIQNMPRRNVLIVGLDILFRIDCDRASKGAVSDRCYIANGIGTRQQIIGFTRMFDGFICAGNSYRTRQESL